LVLIFIPILYSAAILVTKYGSAAQRSTIECARIPVIWLYFMIVPLRYDEKDEKYIYDEDFSWYQLAGFTILFIGVIIYNELVEIPFWGFNKNTKEAIARRELAQESRRSLVIKNDKSSE